MVSRGTEKAGSKGYIGITKIENNKRLLNLQENRNKEVLQKIQKIEDIQNENKKELILQIQEENLPATRDEFLSKARLYHILMDIEEFLKFKERFVASLDS